MKKRSLLLVALTTLLTVSAGFANAADDKVIKVVAKRYEFNPKNITLKVNEPVTLEFTTEDRMHGFNAPKLKVRTNIPVGKVTQLKVMPTKTGEYDFYCDVFCGSGHSDMDGTITVVE